jgi:hypothetical protein
MQADLSYRSSRLALSLVGLELGHAKGLAVALIDRQECLSYY